MQGAQVQFPVGELRSHILWDAAKNLKKKKTIVTRIIISNVRCQKTKNFKKILKNAEVFRGKVACYLLLTLK